MMVARLKGHIHIGAFCKLACPTQRHLFSMRLARFHVMAFRDNLTVAHDHTANHGIGPGLADGLRCLVERHAHVGFVTTHGTRKVSLPTQNL